MNRDDIIRMARDSGLEQYPGWVTDGEGFQNLERFATLAAAAEREACAKVCVKIIDVAEQDLISMDGKPAPMLRGVISGVEECFDAIRARGQE